MNVFGNKKSVNFDFAFAKKVFYRKPKAENVESQDMQQVSAAPPLSDRDVFNVLF